MDYRWSGREREASGCPHAWSEQLERQSCHPLTYESYSGGRFGGIRSSTLPLLSLRHSLDIQGETLGLLSSTIFKYQVLPRTVLWGWGIGRYCQGSHPRLVLRTMISVILSHHISCLFFQSFFKYELGYLFP